MLDLNMDVNSVYDKSYIVSSNAEITTTKQKYVIKNSCFNVPAILSQGDYKFREMNQVIYAPLEVLDLLGLVYDNKNAVIKIIKYPSYAKLNNGENAKNNQFLLYEPNMGFQGVDQIVTQVILDKVQYTIYSTMAVYAQNGLDTDTGLDACRKKLKINKPKIFKVSFTKKATQFAELAIKKLGH